MLALLAVGGEGPSRDRLAFRFDSFDIICAADSGLALLLSWGLEPDLIVGDMDSIGRIELLEGRPHAEVLRFSTDKDESDTEIGLRILRERGATRIVMAGGGGGRLDHVLALRALFERQGAPSEWHTAGEEILFIKTRERMEFIAEIGETISVFPLSEGASEMRSQGLTWPLSGLVWKPGDFGLSNRASSREVVVEAGKGSLLVVRNH